MRLRLLSQNYGWVLADVLRSGWRWPDLRLGIRLRRPSVRGPRAAA